jgi:hypothetical protein
LAPPIALAQTEPTDVVEQTLDLTPGADTPSDERDACITYVEVAARIASGRPVPSAISDVTDREIPAEQPLETGCHAADGLAIGLWALTQPTGFDQLFPRLTAMSSRPAAAAASGLVGLRDGLSAIPPAWCRRLRPTHDCLTLARALSETREAHPYPPTPQAQPVAR